MLLSLFWVSGLEARERQVVAVLPVKVLYPAQGKQWLGYFLQDELSRQFQLQKHFTALSPGEVNRWFQDEDAEEKQLQSFQQSVKPHWILELELQLVLKQLSLTGTFSSINDKIPAQNFKKILPLEKPDVLVKQVLEHLFRKKKESELIHHPQGYSWEGVEAFYLWKHRTPVPQVNSEGWKTRA
ncbi:MAG: hypothetical protein VXC58_08630, partial [Deltaproteobacteria bacterium]